MSKIALQGDASGTGTFTIASPNSNSNYTLNLPTATGTINTSGAVNEVPAGSASAPSIYPTGDTNTGIFFPAADTIAFTEGGTEAMRIDSSGNVGIGATPSAWSGTYKVLEIGNAGNFIAGRSGTAESNFGTNAYFNAGWKYGTTAAAALYQQDSNQHKWFNAASGTAGNAITFTQAMTLDSSGRLLVGTTSTYDFNGQANLVVAGTANNATVIIASTAEGYVSFADGTSGTDRYVGRITYNHTNNYMAFDTNAAERARITSGGEVYIAGTTDQGAYNLQCNGTGVWGAGAYVNGSDARIKEDVEPISSSLSVVEKLNPVTYRYKEDWSKDQSVQTGFIAQELLIALEGQVYVDGVVQQGGSEGYYSVAYQNIIPILTKAIQELKTELDSVKAELASLKGV